MLEPDDSCLACHKFPTILSNDLVTRFSVHLTPCKSKKVKINEYKDETNSSNKSKSSAAAQRSKNFYRTYWVQSIKNIGCKSEAAFEGFETTLEKSSKNPFQVCKG